MFEVGKFYKVTMWEDGQNGGVLTEYGSAKAIKVAIPLVTFRGVTDKTPVIINTASLAFVKAEEAAR
jgi:hypothetical protein